MDAVILDIDFDFCVTPTLEQGYSDPAMLPDGMSLWIEPEIFTSWLGARGLLRPHTVAATVRRHEEVLPVWLRMIRENRVPVPFTVLHVDAHPDLMDLPAEAIGRFQNGTSIDDLLSYAKSGDFLQYAVRLGWTNRILMLFPDREQDRIEAVVSNPVTAGKVVRKPVLGVSKAALGGGWLIVQVGEHVIEVGLFTRESLPTVAPPVVTVVAESPEFIPPSASVAFRRLVGHLRGTNHG